MRKHALFRAPIIVRYITASFLQNHTRSYGSTVTKALPAMRFVQFQHLSGDRKGTVCVGVELSDGGDVVDLTSADTSLPNNMVQFLTEGEMAVEKAKRLVDSGNLPALKKEEFRLLAPITHPDKVLCVGMNYRDHCEEIGAQIPTEPVIFNKFPSTIIGPGEDILYSDESKELDWEVELTIVIGKQGKHISESEAMNHVFGYTVAHDVSARDWQLGRNGGQMLIGKSMDTFCPLGPAIVRKENLSDPHNLGLRCRVNGTVKQNSSTHNLVFRTDTLISHISRFITLLPGDIILTGTPGGVGFKRNPPEFLKRGDIVECEIDEIGTLVNKVV